MTTPHTDSADELARALERIKLEALSLADAQVIALIALRAYRTRPAPETAPFGYVSRIVQVVKEQREVFPGEEPDYLWQFTPGTKHLETYESRPDQIEVIRLYTRPAPRAIPSGWSIKRSNDELVITAPMGDPGGMTIKLDKYRGRLEERLLRALAVAIIGDPK